MITSPTSSTIFRALLFVLSLSNASPLLAEDTEQPLFTIQRFLCFKNQYCNAMSVDEANDKDFALGQQPPFDQSTSTTPSTLGSSNYENPDPTLWMASLSAQLGFDLGISAFQVVLDPVQKTAFFAEVTYPIQKISKQMGDRFEQDEILLQMDDSVARGNYEKAQAEFNQKSIKLIATKQLFQDKLTSYFEYKEAEAEKAKAQAELILTENKLRATTIKAPYSGLVDNIFIEEYELPQQGKELIKIVNDDTLIAKMLIPSKLLHKLKIGTPIYLHISETGEVIEAKISRLGGLIDPASSTIKIEAMINNAEKKYKAGMTGIATFDPPDKTYRKLQAQSL